MMAADPALAATVAKAEAAAAAKGGADPKAVAAALGAAPEAAGWKQSVIDQLTKTRAVISEGMRKTPPPSEYPTAPLVAPLVAALHKKSPADLFVAIGGSLAKHGLLAAPAAAPACPAGTARKALDQARAAAATGDLGAVTGECQAAPPPAPPPAPPKDPKALLTPPAQVPPSVTDQRTTTGAPPSPGPDKDKDSGGPGFFSSLPWSKIGLGAAFGGMMGMAMAFGTPAGLLGGALIGAAIGAVMFSGVIGKLFGGGKN